GVTTPPQVFSKTTVDPHDVLVGTGPDKFSEYREDGSCGWTRPGWDREEILHDPTSNITFLAMNGRAGALVPGCGAKFSHHLLFSSTDGFATAPTAPHVTTL